MGTTIVIVKDTVEDLRFTTVTVDENGAPTNTRVDLTGLPIEFFLRPRVGSGFKEPEISKTEVDFVLLDQIDPGTRGQMTLKLTAAETILLTAGTVVATIFITEASDRRRTMYEHWVVE